MPTVFDNVAVPQFRLTAEVDEARRFYRELKTKGVRRAEANALNKLARRVRKVTIDAVAKKRRVGKRKIGQNIRITQRADARRGALGLRAELRGFGRPISLKEYGARQLKAGVKVNVEGERKLIPGAFIVESLGGHVFVRSGERQLVRSRKGGKRKAQRIRKLWGPSISTGFIKAEVRAAQARTIEREWRGLINAAMRAQLERQRARTVR